MVELDFCYLEGDASLRRMVDRLRAMLDAEGKEWYAYHVLVRVEGTYRCLQLSQLSAELEARSGLSNQTWSLSDPLAHFALEPCASVSVDEFGQAVLRDVREPYLVVEQSGQPVALYAGRSRRTATRTSSVGWWRLIGQRTAELGQVPEWPRPLPDTVQSAQVVCVEPRTTLRELAVQLSGQRAESKTMIALPGADGLWQVYSSGELLDRIARQYPDAGSGSHIGALIEPMPIELRSLERSEAPWPLVEAMLAGSGSASLLIVEDDRPVVVLGAHRVMRGPVTESLDTSWARFLAYAKETEPTAREPGRLVNAWFAGQDREHIPHTHALAANRSYHLAVSIGKRSDKSHVIGDWPTLDARLVNYVLGEDKPLVLRLEGDEDDFVILDRECTVRLPPAGSTEDVLFRIVTPVRTGHSSLRLGIYYHNNLVQCYQVHARIAPGEGQMPEGAGDGWWTECEYTLSADFADLGELRSRRVCVWIGPQGAVGERAAPRVAISPVSGPNAGPSLALNVRLIEESLRRYRELLLQSSVREENRKTRYLYRDDQTPSNPAVFEQAIEGLAELGQMLYQRVFGEGDGRQVTQRLEELQPRPGEPLVVQIARLSLDLAFPWAVLYDRPLYYRPGRNAVCQEFVGEADCSAHCHYPSDWDVICPLGFWGFRYIIEQPLRPPKSYASVVTKLRAMPERRVALVYGTGLDLAYAHQDRLDEILGTDTGRVQPGVASELLEQMRAGPLVVYMYCHGANTPYRQWLVLRDDDPLMASHLGDDLRLAWSDGTSGADRAPLVVLNGCLTGKYDPSTLLSFIHRFGALGAAGVVGTEIPVHETLGTTFGEYFLEHLLRGETVGRIVYDFRRELLEKRNVLGLAYVPYCYADLRVVGLAT